MSRPMNTTTQGRTSVMRTMMKVMGSLHRLLYRLSNGKLGAHMGKMSVLLLTTTGRKTGQPRTWPISYQVDGDNLIMVASAGGQPQHPAWYLNLQAHPHVAVQVGGRTRAMVAHTAQGEERTRLWTRYIQQYPNFAEYQRKTSRELPVVVLGPETG